MPATNARLYSLHISTLFTSELSHISTGSTSLLSPLLYPPPLYSLTSRLSRISTLSRPDSLASLLSPHPCSIHFSALSKSLFSHIPTFSTSWKFVKRSLGPSKLPLKFFWRNSLNINICWRGDWLRAAQKDPVSRMTLSFGFRVTSGGRAQGLDDRSTTCGFQCLILDDLRAPPF